MAEFNYENLAKNLPDCYKKDENSNNYKILEIERLTDNELRDCLNQVAEILNIDKATGATLDEYGKRFGQSRGKATDEQYRVMIKSKVVRSKTNGTYKSIVDAICNTFGCDIDDILILETHTPMTVSLEKAPLVEIIRAGFTTNQAYQIIKKMLPAGVELESVLFEGTFEFSDTEDEYSETAGFAISESDQTIGGYLGASEGDLNEADLPI